MNRKELKEQIISEGKKRKITIVDCRIYDRGERGLEFHPVIRNDHAKGWVYDHQVRELITDLAPLERPHEIADISIDREADFFKIGDKVELDGVWIRLDASEKEPDLIKSGSACGQYRSGWVCGEVFETPAQNDRALGIKFARDVYVVHDLGWIGDVTNLEKLISNGKLRKVAAGQPVWVGTSRKEVRKR